MMTVRDVLKILLALAVQFFWWYAFQRFHLLRIAEGGLRFMREKLLMLRRPKALPGTSGVSDASARNSLVVPTLFLRIIVIVAFPLLLLLFVLVCFVALFLPFTLILYGNPLALWFSDEPLLLTVAFLFSVLGAAYALKQEKAKRQLLEIQRLKDELKGFTKIHDTSKHNDK